MARRRAPAAVPPTPDLEAAGSILRFKMELIAGSSIAPEIIQQVRSHADGVDRVLVLTARHKSENPCDRMGLSQWGGQGAMGVWGCETNPISRGSPDPAPS